MKFLDPQEFDQIVQLARMGRTIEEHFGRGTLFLVFQGYKVLGAIAGIRGRP